jgi:hypothetical protein
MVNIETVEARPITVRARRSFATGAVGTVAVAVVAMLVSRAGRYDYHRDELYFRLLGRHFGWGRFDRPLIAPALARAGIAIFGDSVVGIRILPAAMVGLVTLLLALVAWDAGGGVWAQLLASLGVLTGFPLVVGHSLVAMTPDLVMWLLIVVCAMRALVRRRRRYWLAVVLLSLLWLPDLAAGVVTRDGPLDLSERPLLLGPLVFPIWIAGLVAVLRRRELRRARTFVLAMAGAGALLTVAMGRLAYVCGPLLVLYALGSVAAVRWVEAAEPATGSAVVRSTGRSVRVTAIVIAIAANAAIAVTVALPLLPEQTMARSPIPTINPDVVREIGWSNYVDQIGRVYLALPQPERTVAIIITATTGQAGAVDRYGRPYGLPLAYSGRAGLHGLRRPPASAAVAVVVGAFDPDKVLNRVFERCAVRGHLDNLVGLGGEDQGAPIRICWTPLGSWQRLWPLFRHL